MERDAYIRKDMHANVVLSIGTTMFQEVFERMRKDLTALSPSNKAHVVLLQSESSRYGLEKLPRLSSSFSAEVDLEGQVR